MKIIITGSLGNIGKPLTQILIKNGHAVTVISSKDSRKKDIEALGATAAIGLMENVAFLTETFKGADIVYCMETLDAAGGFFNKDLDYNNTIKKIADNYKNAIQQSGVKHILHLSSIGAHTNKNNGILQFHYNAENILSTLPEDVSIKFMRPVGFYTNLFAFIESIKTKNAIFLNYGGDHKEPWVSPLDIAATIAEEMEKPFTGRSIRYIASDEVSPNEIAKTLGKAIGQPGLKWIVIPGEELLNGMISAGMNKEVAEGFVEMRASQGSGVLYEDYNRNKPILGKIKLADFAKDFANIYHNNK